MCKFLFYRPWHDVGGIWQNTRSQTSACRQKNQGRRVGDKKTTPTKTKQKWNVPFFLPHPQFQMARQVTGSPCWNTLECLLHGGLPASSSSAQWISLKTTSEGFFFFFLKGRPSLDMKFQMERFSFQSSPPLFFHSAWKIWIERS